jgi:hypothetical protein
MEGIKRLFEIVLRPTIIIMALVVSIIIFTASISFFNSALGLYQNASNSDGLIAGLGTLFIYMFGVYTLANASFKIINTLPDGFGRWMGLPNGFGSQIKTGMDSLQGLIATGAAFKSLGDIGSGVSKTGKSIRSMMGPKK